MYQPNTDSSTEIPAFVQAMLDQQNQLITLLMKQQQQQASQHAETIQLLQVQMSELQAQNAQLQQRLTQAQEYHLAQMEQRENHHKELLSKLSVEDKSENYSVEVQQEIDAPNSVNSASSESLQSLPVADVYVPEATQNDEALVKQFSKADDPVNLFSLVEICQTYGKFVVGKQETDTTFSTHSNISQRKFLSKVLDNGKKSKQPSCFISKFNLSKASELGQLIDACPTGFLKSLVIHNCHCWSRLLVNESNPEDVASIEDFLFIKTLLEKYGSKKSLSHFLGNSSAYGGPIENSNRNAYFSVCESDRNAAQFKAVFSNALNEKDSELLLLLVKYGLGRSDLCCEKLLCERGVPKKTDNGVWQFSGIKLTALLFVKSVRQGWSNTKNNVDTIKVLVMLCERGYGEQAVACLDNEFYTSLDSDAAAFLFQKVPLCRLGVLQEIFLNKNHRRHYEDYVVEAQRQSKFESNFIQSIAKDHLLDLSELLACVSDKVKHAVISRLLQVDSLHDIYASLRQSKAINVVDLLNLFCFSFDGVAKKEYLEKAQVLQVVDPVVHRVIKEILTKMQSPASSGSSQAFKTMLANFSKAATDSEKQAQVYKALKHAISHSCSDEVNDMVSTLMTSFVSEQVLRPEEQLEFLQNAFESLSVDYSEFEGATRVMAYIAPLMYQLTPKPELQYDPPVRIEPSAPPLVTPNYSSSDRVSQFSTGSQGEVDGKANNGLTF